jgi:hypothetical protein
MFKGSVKYLLILLSFACSQVGKSNFTPTEIASILRRADKELSGNTWHLGENDYLVLGDSLLINPSGMHYVYTYNRQNDTFFRRDVSKYHGHNFGRHLFLYKGDIYSLGGYGFWKSHAKLLKFEWRTGEWEIIQYHEKLIPGKPISYFIRNDTLHILGLFVIDQQRSVNEIQQHYYRVSLQTMEVEEFAFNQRDKISVPHVFNSATANNQFSRYSIIGIDGSVDQILDVINGQLYINKSGPNPTRRSLGGGGSVSNMNYSFARGDSIHVMFENGDIEIWDISEYIKLYCKPFWSLHNIKNLPTESDTSFSRTELIIGTLTLFLLVVMVQYVFIRRERVALRKWKNIYEELGDDQHVFRNIQSLTSGLYTEREFDIALNIIHLPKDVRNIKRSRLMFIVNDDLPGFIQKEKNDKSPDVWLYRINNRH